MSEDKDLKAEIGKHLMQPENYGKLEDADCIGVGIDHATKSYVIMYIKRDEKSIVDVKFGTNGTQDTTTLGSLFTEMIKGDEIKSALETTANLEKNLHDSYAAIPVPKVDTSKPEGEQVERVSTEHQDSANMVLTAFRAAMRHYDRKQGGIEEEQFELSISKTCPYSTTECHFVQKASKEA
ncbi:MAG: iron-sulfur cluster assembly scaffold protein [Sulfurimonas sp. RIFOXYD12_FULL_33_39]|uniref:iron-sulfur cluster assembly scaffold protein n=1 Tax=unclassified Sulfurimonas TaxID=2623549 RepID=UPI0008D47E02|nr:MULTISPECIES: iron-sulfur cluster assembly scaffold protein [unclassified Sulfurimonas]OHE07697.1 MAG: iron-sulfur cluster assembly scaffold protein [Sulfurimonas sp. RIFCSPLOWO2_12_FULL_34_6]OHE10739.1 MAG: iron-sulfur cluster assembly scaffold protein [Sulfurimonas sp. RIFOXYD12_FULL_33_39]OHE13491.1 MAG: iron-sulfur cluster assembly scaffold protein [Sulfurimonas sp. RIFOXYD2_FULL_34_21]